MASTQVQITRKQRTVLEALTHHEGVTARALSDHLETPAYRTARFTYDEVYGQLAALERKGLAARERRPGARANHWNATAAGHAALTDG